MQIICDNALGSFLSSTTSRTNLDTLKLGETAIDQCELWLMDPPANAGAGPQPMQIPAGFTKAIICGRSVDDVQAINEAADPLFSMVVGAAELVAGDSPYYQGTLNLNVSALETALQGEKTLQVLIDVDLENDDATARRRIVMQGNGLVYRAVYRGTEGVPTSGSPAYPVPGALLTTGVDSATIKRGTVNVGNNAGSQAVAFTTAFGAGAPSTVQAWLMVPSGGALIECAVDWSTITANGFTAVFGANTPAGTYRLGWLALQ